MEFRLMLLRVENSLKKASKSSYFVIFVNINLARQPVDKKQAQRQVFWLKILTGYWTEIFMAEYETEKPNRFLKRKHVL